MTEKMLDVLYDSGNNELSNERAKCKDLCYEYNRLHPSDIEKQREIIRILFGSTKDSFTVTASFWCDYGYNIGIGENFYVNHNCMILDAAKYVWG